MEHFLADFSKIFLRPVCIFVQYVLLLLKSWHWLMLQFDRYSQAYAAT